MDYDDDTPPEARFVEAIALTESRLDNADFELRYSAASDLHQLCCEFPEHARAAMPVLFKYLLDATDKVAEAAVYALPYCKPDSIEPLIELLRSPRADVRRRAARSLGNVGADAISACDRLRILLADPVQDVRASAAWALGQVPDTNERTVALLFQMVKSKIAKDRSSALHALGYIGKAVENRAAFQAQRHDIIAALDDEDDDVRWSACIALEGLDLAPQDLVDLLVRRLDVDHSRNVQQVASWRINELARTADLSRHLEVLCAFVRKGDYGSSDICRVLGGMGPVARSAVPTLIEALGVERTCIDAAKALWQIDRRIDESLPYLEKAFEDSGESVCDVICEIGPAAAPWIDSVIAALESEDWDLQWAAADALGCLASYDPRTLAALGEALQHPSALVASAAANSLSMIGAPAVPMLIDTLLTQGPTHGEWSADALGRMGPRAADCADALRGKLDSPTQGLAIWCAIALAKVAGDPIVVPRLIGLVRDHERPDIREQAAVGLGAIGPAAAEAIATLMAAGDDPDEKVRSAAENALEAIQTVKH